MDKKHLQHSILETTYDSKQWRSLMEEYFGARNFLQQPKPISLPANDFADAAFELGNFNTADERIVGIYEVKLNPKAWIERNSVGLRSLWPVPPPTTRAKPKATIGMHLLSLGHKSSF